jgi:hypothetical protein
VQHEEGQQIESLGLEADDIGAAPQFAALGVEPVIVERQSRAIPRKLPTCIPVDEAITSKDGEEVEARLLPFFSATRKAA